MPHSKLGAIALRVFTFLGTPPFYLPLGLGLLVANRHLGIVYALAIVATEVVCAALKLATRTERPTPQKRITWYDQYDASTFPSAHTARLASNVTVLWAGYPSWGAGLVAAGLIVGVGISRVKTKHHYWVDVGVGAVVGIAVSWSLFRWLA